MPRRQAAKDIAPKASSEGRRHQEKEGRRALQANSLKKIPRKKTEFQTGGFHPFSRRR